MSYLVFARKYRPQGFAQVVQQDHVTRTLTNAISAGRVSHAILFTGPRGTGKTTVARIMAKSMNCAQGPTPTPCNVCRSCVEITNGHAADVFEIDGASNNSVDQVRELRENLKYMPSHSRYKIYIIDEVHMLSLAAFNALLKTLEEPPAHVLFIFATTEPQKIPVTILSRCQRHDLRRIDLAAIVGQMQQICAQEGVSIPEESLALIAREAGGSMRDALSLLDHVLACAEGPVTDELVAELLGAAEQRHLFEISAAVLARDIQQVLAKVDGVWRQGLEMKRFYADMVAHFHNLVVVKLGERASRLVDLPAHAIKQMHSQVQDIPESFLIQVLDQLFSAEPSIKLSAQPKLALEMVFLKMFQTPPLLPIDRLIDRLDQLRFNPAPARTPRQSEAATGPGVSATLPVADASEPVEPSSHSANSDSSLLGQLENPSPRGTTFWDQILHRVQEEKPSLLGFLKKCRSGGVSGSQLAIEVCGNEFTFKSVQKHASYLEEICAQLAGQPITLSLTANCDDAGLKQKEKQKTEQLKQKALSHPRVMETIELFNGKVIDVKLP
jgi:DNA polymerase III subunit gamma/tau